VYRREPTDCEFYALWNAPQQALTGHLTSTVAARARRYANLCRWHDQALASTQTGAAQASKL
jgi:hypothetical protein